MKRDLSLFPSIINRLTSSLRYSTNNDSETPRNFAGTFRYAKRNLPKSDYAGQISFRARKEERSPKPLGRKKNSFSEQTTAKFVRPMPRTVGFAARGTVALRNHKDRPCHLQRDPPDFEHAAC